mgnify:CR=1 FL=1
MTDWEIQADTWIDIAYSCMHTPLLPKYQYHVIDRCLRGASDIISCESTAVHSNTASLIQWCKQWSKGAVQEYAQLFQLLKQERAGKPPTHRQVCESRDASRKRHFTAEHQFPIMIPKKGIRDRRAGPASTQEILSVYNAATRHGTTPQQLGNVLSKDQYIIKVGITKVLGSGLSGKYDICMWDTVDNIQKLKNLFLHDLIEV